MPPRRRPKRRSVAAAKITPSNSLDSSKKSFRNLSKWSSYAGAESVHKQTVTDRTSNHSRTPGPTSSATTLKAVYNELLSDPGYAEHHPMRKNFPRAPVRSRDIDDLWQADLVDMSALFRQNSGHRFILTIIDVLSKFAWAIPLKRKTAVEVHRAFKQVFASPHPSTNSQSTDH